MAIEQHEDRPKRILVVEDDPDQREIYSTLLFYNGFDVDEAGSMNAALETLKTSKPDAILMDMVLPDANGLDAVSVIKTMPATADIPILCMTAYDIAPRSVSAAGCVALLRKPFDGGVLVPAVLRALRDDDPES